MSLLKSCIDRLARAFYPAILACWNSEEGQREFAAWQAEQAHHTPSKEKQSVPTGSALLYISLLSVVFGRVRPIQGRTLFLFYLYSSMNSHSSSSLCLANRDAKLSWLVIFLYPFRVR